MRRSTFAGVAEDQLPPDFGAQPGSIFRWHITRLTALTVGYPVVQDPAVQSTVEEVGQSSGQEPRLAFLSVRVERDQWVHREAALRDPTSLGQDSIEYWGDQDLNGWGMVSDLERVVASQNWIEGDAAADSASERALREDAVLLQVVSEQEPFRGLHDSLAASAVDGGPPDLHELITWEGARWIDFTQQARAMAKQVYDRVLGTDQLESHGLADGQ